MSWLDIDGFQFMFIRAGTFIPAGAESTKPDNPALKLGHQQGGTACGHQLFPHCLTPVDGQARQKIGRQQTLIGSLP